MSPQLQHQEQDTHVGPSGLMVSEIFGPTLQGEGPYLGKPCIFLRTQYCPVGCAWCDTKYTWTPREDMRMPYDVIIGAIEAAAGKVRHLVISGGEPFAQPKGVEAVCKLLLTRGWDIEIETSGTFDIPTTIRGLVHINCSPKPPSAHSKMPTLPHVIAELKNFHDAAFKFVVRDQTDLDWVKEFCETYELYRNVFIMPEGINDIEVRKHMTWLWDEVPKQIPNARVTPRMHIYIHGARRGV